MFWQTSGASRREDKAVSGIGDTPVSSTQLYQIHHTRIQTRQQAVEIARYHPIGGCSLQRKFRMPSGNLLPGHLERL
jgi:hypothetical protein